MDYSPDPPATDRLVELVEDGDPRTADHLERYAEASADERKAALGALRTLAERRPDALEPLLPRLSEFLRDEERPVRLTAAKLFVAVAAGEPDAVVPAVPSLADRLADEGSSTSSAPARPKGSATSPSNTPTPSRCRRCSPT